VVGLQKKDLSAGLGEAHTLVPYLFFNFLKDGWDDKLYTP